MTLNIVITFLPPTSQPTTSQSTHLIHCVELNHALDSENRETMTTTTVLEVATKVTQSGCRVGIPPIEAVEVVGKQAGGQQSGKRKMR